MIATAIGWDIEGRADLRAALERVPFCGRRDGDGCPGCLDCVCLGHECGCIACVDRCEEDDE